MTARPAKSSGAPATDLGPFLDALHARFNRPEYVSPDPIELAHGWDSEADAEVAAFLAASISYGRVAQIIASGRKLLRALGESPAKKLREATPAQLKKRLAGVVHRFNDGADFALFCSLIGQALRERGSLGALFEASLPPPAGEPPEPDLQPALARFMATLAEGDAAPFHRSGAIPQGASVHYLMPRPERGSACKRLFMFLRWMVRPKDAIDLGLWSGLASPSRLLMPVDTHVLRLSNHLGLSAANAASLRASREITASLRLVSPDDPTRYDFALSRLGILAHCPSRERLELCESCDLAPACKRRAAMLAEG